MKSEQHKDQSFFIDGLVIVALWSMAITQPLLNSLGNAATFFVAHDANRFQILSFVILVGFVAPLLLILVEFLVGKISRHIRVALHAVMASLLAIGIVLILLNKTSIANPIIVLYLSALIGLALAGLILFWGPARSITAIASVGAILFPIVFIFFTSVSSVVFGKVSVHFQEVDVKSSTPVVLVVFDEFTPLALLDSEHYIDPVRFPNFSKLAETSTWFPNAASVHYRTRIAIPAILTGKNPPKNAKELPTQTEYPDNLFSLLGGNYSLNVVERISTLCPKAYCNSEESGARFQWPSFWADVTVIFKHIFYPRLWAENYLPALDTGWSNFVNAMPINIEFIESDDDAKTTKTSDELALEKVVVDRRKLSRKQIFKGFLDGITSENSTLDFIHIVIPHGDWTYLPDGRSYENHRIIRALPWKTQATADGVYHRYLMQVGYVDKMLGDLVSRLKKSGKYDDALMIIVADHGFGFQQGMTGRDISKEPAVLHIPLFVKYPRQKEGVINEKYVYNIDVVPTIADVLNVDLPWSVDGESLLDETPRKEPTIKMKWNDGNEYQFTQDQIINLNAVPDRIAKFGDREPLDELSIKGAYSSLIGLSTSEFDGFLTASPIKSSIHIDAEDFSNISLSDDYLPAMLYGTIQLVGKYTGPLSIAVVLNGKISAVVPVTGVDLVRDYAVLLPPADFKNGKNEIEAFLVSSDDGKYPILSSIELPNSYSLSMWNGQETLVDSTNNRIQIEKIDRPGYFSISDRGENNVFTGWAADIKKGQPADSVVAFQDTRFLGATQTGQPSPGLADTLNKKTLESSRFRLSIRKSTLHENLENIRLFGIYPGGFAAELDNLPN